MNGLWLGAAIALFVAVAINTLLIGVLFRLIGVVMVRLGPNYAKAVQKLTWEERVPTSTFVTIEGNIIPSAVSQPTLLVYMSPRCGVCRQLPPAVRAIHPYYRSHVRFVALVEGTREEVAEWAGRRLKGIPVLATEDQAPALSEGLPSPYAVVISATGHPSAHGIVNDREMLESLIIDFADPDDPGHAEVDSDDTHAVQTVSQATSL